MKEDAELAQRLYAVAGRLLDASTLTGDKRALQVARTTAELARHLLAEADEGYRAIARVVLGVEDAAGVRAAEILREWLH